MSGSPPTLRHAMRRGPRRKPPQRVVPPNCEAVRLLASDRVTCVRPLRLRGEEREESHRSVRCPPTAKLCVCSPPACGPFGYAARSAIRISTAGSASQGGAGAGAARPELPPVAAARSVGRSAPRALRWRVQWGETQPGASLRRTPIPAKGLE